MPKGSPELTQARQDEIVTACAKLYETMGFKEITIKEIANFTSFTRPSIYNYFQTKEEIFLKLFQQEYEIWTKDINSLQPLGKKPPKLEFAEKIAHTLECRGLLLKLLSTNLNEMERNSRIENLIEFKKAYGASIEAVKNCLERFCPDMAVQEKEEFMFAFFPFIYGIYPYVIITEKQREAMKQAKVSYHDTTIYELAYLGTRKLLGS